MKKFYTAFLFIILSTANLFAQDFPMDGYSLGGKLRAAPDASSELLKRIEGKTKIRILEDTGVVLDNFPWLKIEAGGAVGYQWGALICSHLPTTNHECFDPSSPLYVKAMDQGPPESAGTNSSKGGTPLPNGFPGVGPDDELFFNCKLQNKKTCSNCADEISAFGRDKNTLLSLTVDAHIVAFLYKQAPLDWANPAYNYLYNPGTKVLMVTERNQTANYKCDAP